MGYLDFAERQEEREQTMTMEDWAKHLDNIHTMSGEKLLVGNGSISHLRAMEKVENEYKVYKAKILSDVEKDYLESIQELEGIASPPKKKKSSFLETVAEETYIGLL